MIYTHVYLYICILYIHVLQESEGRVGEAARIRERLDPIKHQYESEYKNNNMKKHGVDRAMPEFNIDFSNPLEILKLEAKAAGLNLEDPRLQKVMEELANEKTTSPKQCQELIASCVERGT